MIQKSVTIARTATGNQLSPPLHITLYANVRQQLWSLSHSRRHYRVPYKEHSIFLSFARNFNVTSFIPA
jgi:hypothetical protein